MSDPQPLAYESPQTAFSGVAIGTIALQLVGVYFFIHALPMLMLFMTAMGIFSATVPYSVPSFFASFIPLALYISAGVLLIRFAPRISTWLFRDAGGGIMSGPITTETGRQFQAIAFSVVGVIAAVAAIPVLAQLLWVVFADMGQYARSFVDFIPPLAQLAIGVALFLQSKGLSLLWHRIRNGGTSNASTDTPEGSL